MDPMEPCHSQRIALKCDGAYQTPPCTVPPERTTVSPTPRGGCHQITMPPTHLPLDYVLGPKSDLSTATTV